MEAIVETSGGPVRGATEPTAQVTVFRGIPYAACPTGRLRFRAPVPAPRWGDIFDASSFGSSPMQSKSSIFAGGIPGNQVGDISEDCLTINVWVPPGPPPVEGRPVMVWVYGGAFLTGSTSIETYDPVALASTQEVIVVSANYRVGLFGFCAVAGGDTNVGLRDQLFALQWVRSNIASFGGDPANITVFGESAGAGLLLHLLSSPLSGGLVRRAILQSPGVEHTLSADDASRVTGATLVALGLAHDEADRLWELPAAALVDAQEQALSGLFTTIGSMPFHPVVDGDFLPAKPGVDFSAPSIDLLVTWTADEMRLYPNQHVDAGGRDRLIRWTQRLVAERIGSDPGRDRIEDLIEFYQDGAAGTDRTSGADIWAAIQTDALMRLPARRVALDHARSADIGRSTYIAQFDWRAHGGEWERGAFHAIDLPCTFATLDRCGWSDFLGVGDDGGRADELARRHMQRWGSFARSGDPGWAAVSADRRPTLVMNSEDRLDDDPLLDAAAAWEGLWSADGPPPA